MPLVPTQVGQEGAKLGHCDGEVVPVAGQEILQDYGGRLGLGVGVVFSLGQHIFQGTQQQNEEQYQTRPMQPDAVGGTAMKRLMGHGFV